MTKFINEFAENSRRLKKNNEETGAQNIVIEIALVDRVGNHHTLAENTVITWHQCNTPPTRPWPYRRANPPTSTCAGNNFVETNVHEIKIISMMNRKKK
jgi:hypothetical protein